MKKRYFILGIIILILSTYCVDKKFFMKYRVLKHNLWEHHLGEKISGDFIETGNATFNGDTMILDYINKKIILKYQYFNTMKVMDLETKKTGLYTMKGANWTDYIFK